MTRTGRIIHYVMGGIAAVAILSFAPTARSLTNDTSVALAQGSAILVVLADHAPELPSLDVHDVAPIVLPAAPFKAPSLADVVPCIDVQTPEGRCLPGRGPSPVKHLHEQSDAEPSHSSDHRSFSPLMLLPKHQSSSEQSQALSTSMPSPQHQRSPDRSRGRDGVCLSSHARSTQPTRLI
jgi:hypothetical protein